MKTLKVGADRRRNHAKIERSEDQLQVLRTAAQARGLEASSKRRDPALVRAAAQEHLGRHAATRLTE